jgi:tripartite-type tricarboxylate transporter receptor subunit TctC
MRNIMSRRWIVAGSASLAASAAMPSPGRAQAGWPVGEIRLYVPASPGGSTDLLARLLKTVLDRELGATVVVVNQTAGGGTVATENVIQAKPDGGTLLVHHALLHTTNLFGRSKNSYRNLEPLATISEVNNLLATRADAPFSTMAQLKASLAAGGAGRLRLASQLGGTTQVLGQAVARWAGTGLRVVDAGSEADRIAALLGKQVDLALLTVSTAKQYERSGDVKVLALFNRQPDPIAPEWPTAASAGLDVHFPLTFTLYGPPGLPADLVGRVDAALARAAKDPAVAAQIAQIQQSPSHRDAAATRRYLDGEFAFVAEMIRAGQAGQGG